MDALCGSGEFGSKFWVRGCPGTASARRRALEAALGRGPSAAGRESGPARHRDLPCVPPSPPPAWRSWEGEAPGARAQRVADGHGKAPPLAASPTPLWGPPPVQRGISPLATVGCALLHLPCGPGHPELLFNQVLWEVGFPGLCLFFLERIPVAFFLGGKSNWRGGGPGCADLRKERQTSLWREALTVQDPKPPGPTASPLQTGKGRPRERKGLAKAT